MTAPARLDWDRMNLDQQFATVVRMEKAAQAATVELGRLGLLKDEMLEALKQTTSWLEAIMGQGLINPQSSVPDWIKKGNAAIAKAEGRLNPISSRIHFNRGFWDAYEDKKNGKMKKLVEDHDPSYYHGYSYGLKNISDAINATEVPWRELVLKRELTDA